MANMNFLQALLEFKRDLINEETVELMEPYIRMDDYDLETAKRVCGNVAGLLSWTVAMTNFFDVNKEVLPLKDNLKIQEVKLKGAMDELNRAQSQLDEKERETQEALREYNTAIQEKQQLENDAESTYFLPLLMLN
jgi:dynein heavy chain